MTTATNNTFVGGGAGQNKTGSFNTAVGFASQQIASASQYNTSLGYQAHLNSGGNYNTAIGVNSLLSSTSGSNNTAVGNNTAQNCKTSANCSFFGDSADQDVNTATYTNSTAIGNGAIINASNQIILGNSSVTSVKTSGLMNASNYLVNGTNINTIYAPIASPTFTGTVSGITKSMAGLGNVDNTSDISKPISTATQSALDLKVPINNATLTGTTTVSTLSCGNTTINSNGLLTGNIGLSQNTYVDTHTKAIGVSNVKAASFTITGMQNTALQVTIPSGLYVQATSAGATSSSYVCNYSIPTIQILKNNHLFALPTVTTVDDGSAWPRNLSVSGSLTSGPVTSEAYKVALQVTFTPDTAPNSTDVYTISATTTQTGRSASSQVTFVEGFVYNTTGGVGLSYYRPYSVVRTNIAIPAGTNTGMVSSPNMVCSQLVRTDIQTNTITCNSVITPWGGVGVYMINDNVTPGNTSFLYNVQYGLLASRKYMGFVDDMWVVLPGFKAVLYPSANYGGTPLATIDATISTSPISMTSQALYGSPNLTGSVRVYYQENEQTLLHYS